MMHRVLIVDDDQLVADTLSLIFNKCGYDATAAYSADQAMEFARGVGARNISITSGRMLGNMSFVTLEVKSGPNSCR